MNIFKCYVQDDANMAGSNRKYSVSRIESHVDVGNIVERQQA